MGLTISDVQHEIAKVKPYLPEPVGIAGDLLSAVLAIWAGKKATSAHERARRVGGGGLFHRTKPKDQ